MEYKKVLRWFVAFSVSAVVFPVAAFAEEGETTGYDQNLKSNHLRFKNQAINNKTLADTYVMPQISRYQLFAGSIIPGVLVTGLNSDLPGSVIGQVAQNVYSSVDGNYLLIPQGTKLIGMYDSETAYAQNRAAIVWQRMIFPNGDSMVIPNFNGADMQGYNGFKDKKRSHMARVVWTALLGGAAIGGINAAADRKNQSEFAEDAMSEVNSNLSSVIDKIVDKNLNIAPTIIIRPGYKFNIIIEQDLLLKPYVEN